MRARLRLSHECLRILLEAVREAQDPPEELLNRLEIAVKKGQNSALIPPQLLPELLAVFEAYAAKRCGKERCPCQGYSAYIRRNVLCWIRYRLKHAIRRWRSRGVIPWQEAKLKRTPPPQHARPS